jgi:predicted  nucleic acid-binding Zn-ribbon protein
MTTITLETTAEFGADEVLERLRAERAETVDPARELRATAERAGANGDPSLAKSSEREARELEGRVEELDRYVSERLEWLRTERRKATDRLEALRKERVTAVGRAVQTEAAVKAAKRADGVRFDRVLKALGELPAWQREMVIAKVGPETSRQVWADIAAARAAKAAADVQAIEESIANATARLEELGGPPASRAEKRDG